VKKKRLLGVFVFKFLWVFGYDFKLRPKTKKNKKQTKKSSANWGRAAGENA
jgi:hypothetical protein